MKPDSDEVGTPRLRRALGTFDIVLLNVAAIVGLRWLSFAAQIGPSSLTLWVLGLITFFIPSALTVLELSSRLPGEGGIYLWSKTAFGDMHGFIVGWSYWIANLVFFPALLLFAAGVFLYIPAGDWLKLGENTIYNGVFCLATLWFVILLNINGLSRAKWLQNVGAVATWATGVMVLWGGILAWHRFGAATPITTAGLVPNLGSLATLASFATIALAFEGLELGPILGGEIKNPRRAIARALPIACVLVAVLYIAGTASLFLALPAQQIDSISGVPQALAAVGARIGVPLFGIGTAALLTLSQIGSLGAWVTGTARLPFLFGLDRYLPSALATVHPRFGSPHVALIVQGVLATIILLAAISGSAVHEAYLVLVDMTLILTFVPLLYMFVAAPILRGRAPAGDPGVTLVPGGRFASWLVAGSGFAVTLLAVVVAMIPPSDSTNRTLFAIKVIGGSAVLLAIGLAFYFRGRRILANHALSRGAPA
jgi:amino acid transporter